MEGHYNYTEAKERWHEICTSNVYMPIYHKNWYWDAVCGMPDDWKVIVYDGKDAIAGFPFQYDTIHGMGIIRNAWQVARGGIWISLKKDISFEKKMHLYDEITQYMIERIPKYDYFNVNFLPAYENGSSFSWNGFDASICYNYVIEDRLSEEIKQNCSKKRRQRINTAQKKYTVRLDGISIDDYWDFFSETFRDRGKVLSFEKERFEKLIKVLKEHNAVQIRSAYDGDGDIVAVAICLMDDKSLYHQFCANKYGNEDAQSLLTYDAICFAMDTGRRFDFEGSMIKGVAEYNFSFSPDTEQCLVIHKESTRYSILNLGSRAVNKIKNSVKQKR